MNVRRGTWLPATGGLLEASRSLTSVEEKNICADYHQPYLAKNPGGYRGLGGCGVTFNLE
jgi:hypothetical protein